MFISLYLNPRSTDPLLDLRVIDATIEQAIEADAAGFSALLLTEHHFSGVNSYQDPFMLGCYLAPQLVNRAYLNIGVLCVPYHHPLRMVEYCNLLDVLTKGRLMVGVGSGGITQLEYEAFGVDNSRKQDMLEQKLEVMLKAWAYRPGDEPLDVSTDWDTGTLLGRLMPPSYRSPHPLLARVSTRPEMMIDAGERGWPLMFGLSPTPEQLEIYRGALHGAGHPDSVVADGERWLCHTKYVWVAETDEQAWKEIQPTFDDIMEKSGWVGKGDHARYATAEDFLHQTAIVGSPETVARRIVESNSEYGVDHIRLWFNYWYLSTDLAAVRRSFRLFVDEVMPQLEVERMPDPLHTIHAATDSMDYAVPMEGMDAELGADQLLPSRVPQTG
jgi:alkanesulfonate monooxygenase SsuD/methylene tetrahydromethanopterin reductase-like flavin-dependent oxidoreductase (luciferase family)